MFFGNFYEKAITDQSTLIVNFFCKELGLGEGEGGLNREGGLFERGGLIEHLR